MFGEKIEGYPVGMVNEREIRAGAGILFFIGIVVFMVALVTIRLSFDNPDITPNFEPAKYMIIGFLIDFIIRIINPKYTPSLIIGRIIVSGQQVEYVGAKQKRFAWGIGVILAVIMLWTMVINDVRGPVNLLICGLCLILLFIESVFGICLGCKVYNLFDKEQNKYCAGGICEVKQKEAIQKVNILQILSVFILAGILFAVPYALNYFANTVEKDCTVPQFAIDMGHIQQWKAHNGCE